jgi:hypothetical protein
VPRAEEGRFDDLLAVADLERLVSSGALRTPGLRLVKEGGTISEGQYAREISWRPKPFTGVVDPDRVAEAFADGSTIVLQALHHTWPPLARFCVHSKQSSAAASRRTRTTRPAVRRALLSTTTRTTSSSSRSPARSTGGIYEPLLELPLKAQRWSSSLGSPGPTVLELTLRAGDTLYLPRGWLHDALTSDTDSLHITVGVNVHTWIDAFRAALDECAGRRRVPPLRADRWRAPGRPGRAVTERLDPRTFGDGARAKFVESRRPILDGHLQEVRELDSVTITRRSSVGRR